MLSSLRFFVRGIFTIFVIITIVLAWIRHDDAIQICDLAEVSIEKPLLLIGLTKGVSVPRRSTIVESPSGPKTSESFSFRPMVKLRSRRRAMSRWSS